MVERPKPNARNQVPYIVENLGRQIVSGTYNPGESLPIEAKLASILNVRRNALREGVKVLAGKGLLSTAPRNGTKVRSRKDWNLLDPDVLSWYSTCENKAPAFISDLIEMRRIIEPKAAELAASRADRDNISQIMSALEAMEQSVQTGDHKAYIKSDTEFHSAILIASHNAVLANFRSAITAFLKTGFTITLDDRKAARDALKRHRRIALAIAAGDPQKAREAVLGLLGQSPCVIDRRARSSQG